MGEHDEPEPVQQLKIFFKDPQHPSTALFRATIDRVSIEASMIGAVC